METTDTDLPQRIAARVRELRSQRGLSLEALAARAGVSRSMISLIERGESSPTAVVLERLATGLGVVLAHLFEPAGTALEASASPVARHDEQTPWRDPASGYQRRNVSPAGAHPFRIVDVHFPPGARVAFESGERESPVHQQVWLLEGEMDVASGADRFRLKPGDCFAMTLDAPTMFHNPTRQPARYAVVIASSSSLRR